MKIQTINQTMRNLGYNKSVISEDAWIKLVEDMAKIIHGRTTFNQQKQASLLVDAFIGSYPTLKYSIIHDIFYLGMENSFIYKRFHSQEFKIHIASFIKSFEKDLYTPAMTKRIIELLMEEVSVMAIEENINPNGKISFLNGYLDIDKKKFHTSIKHPYIFTHQLKCEYQVECTQSNLNKADNFIKSFICSDWNEKNTTAHVKLLYSMLWYGMKEEQNMKKTLVLYGDTNTGKSVFPAIWHKLLGRKFTTIVDDIEMKLRDQFFLSSIADNKVVYIDEVRGYTTKFKNFMKAYSTKQENMKVRIPGGESVEVDISFLLVFGTNEIFSFKEDSGAVRSRLIPVYFAHEHNVNPNWDLDNILTPEVLNAIINRALYAGEKVKKEGFILPKQSKDLLDDFTRHTDPLIRILEEYIKPMPGAYVKTNILLQNINNLIENYNRSHSREEAIKLMSRKTFKTQFASTLKKMEIPYEEKRKRIEITNGDLTRNIRTRVYEGIMWDTTGALAKEMNDWDRIQAGLLYDDEELIPEDKSEEEKYDPFAEQKLPF